LLFSPGYLLILLAGVVLGGLTQAYVATTYRKFAAEPLHSGLTGSEVARRMLDAEGLRDVSIEMIPGRLTDHFDPRVNVLRLSEDVFGGRHLAAAGVAAHEAGHAVQHARGYVPARVRSTLVPVANIGSQGAWVFIILGLALSGQGQAQLGSGLAWLGVAVRFGRAVSDRHPSGRAGRLGARGRRPGALRPGPESSDRRGSQGPDGGGAHLRRGGSHLRPQLVLLHRSGAAGLAFRSSPSRTPPRTPVRLATHASKVRRSRAG
jgi:Zn-dependent membrane protease YugP